MLAPKGANLKKVDVSWGGGEEDDGRPRPSSSRRCRTSTRTTSPRSRTRRTCANSRRAPDAQPRVQLRLHEVQVGGGGGAVRLGRQHLHLPRHLPRRRAEARQARARRRRSSRRPTRSSRCVKRRSPRSRSARPTCRTSSRRRPTRRTELIAKAEATAKRLNLAERLVNGLATRTCAGANEHRAARGGKRCSSAT